MDTADVNFAFKSNVIGQNVGFTGFNIQLETKATLQKASYPTTTGSSGSSYSAPYDVGSGDYGCLPTFGGINSGNNVIDIAVNTLVGTYNLAAGIINQIPNRLGAVKEAIDYGSQQVLGMDSTQLAHELYATGLLWQTGFALDAFNTWATLAKAANTSKVAQTAITASQVAINIGAEALGIENKKVFKNQTLLQEHYSKHKNQIIDILGRENYSLDDYVNDANYIINNGTYVPELNGYIHFMKNKNYGFVGIDRATGDITTFHIKSVKELVNKAPSLGFEL